MPPRGIKVKRGEAGSPTLNIKNIAITSVEIAALDKLRGRIELLFGGLKRILTLAKFPGRTENAIRLRIYAASIAFLLHRTAARTLCISYLATVSPRSSATA